MEGKSPQLLTDEELLYEVSHNLPGLLSYPEILKDFRLKFLSQPVTLRQALAQKLIAALKINNQSLGIFLVTKKGLRMPPLIANWLKDYADYITGKIDKNRAEEYLRPLKNQNLPEKTLTLLKNLFEIFTLIDQVAEKPAVLETIVIKDKDGRLKMMEEGKLTELSPALPPVVENKVFIPSAPDLPPEPEGKTPLLAVSGKETADYSDIPEDIHDQLYGIHEGQRKESITNSNFNPEDGEEISGHQKNISSFKLSETLSVDEVINKIISKYNLAFDDEILKKRFYSIAGSRLKEIRTESDTLDLLTRSSKIGGLDYPEEKAESIISDLREEIPRLQAVKQKEEIRPNIPVPTPKEALQATLKQEKIFTPVFEETNLPQEIEEFRQAEEKTPSVKEVLPKPAKTQAQVLFEKALSKLREETALNKEKEREAPPLKMQRPEVSSKKPRLEDIKGKAKISGPVEELRMLNLNDFRHSGNDRVSAVRKVYDKINLLKEDSFSHFAAGIKAWRESEVYQLYLGMGRQSLEKAKTIREVVEERTASGQPSLTEKEFSDLADLNKELRF